MALVLTILGISIGQNEDSLVICISIPLVIGLVALTQAAAVSIDPKGVTVRYLLRVNRRFRFESEEIKFYESYVFAKDEPDIAVRGSIIPIRGRHVSFFSWAVTDFKELNRILRRLYPQAVHKKN